MFKKPFCLLQLRFLSTSNCLNGESRMMKKILSGPRKQKKFKYSETPIVSTTNTISAITNDSKKSVNTKRVNVLNKLFMRHITDLMSTGTYSNAFTGHGIEINRVRVASDFKRIQVYWLARSDNLVENIDEILVSHASALRHELSQMRVMGVVPKIEFVKDVHFTMLKLLDDKLAQADYGDDHVPLDNTSRLKQELELQTNLEFTIRKQIEELDIENDNLDNHEEEIDVPDMPQNVLGLNHADIMQKVLKSMNKSQGLQRQPTSTKIPHNEVNTNPMTYSSMKQQREAFREFLNKRQLMKLKAGKEDKTYRPEMDYLEEEWEKQREVNLKKYDFHEYLIDNKDYLDIDDFDSKDDDKK